MAGARSDKQEQQQAVKYAFHNFDFIMLRTVIFEIAKATMPKTASTTIRSAS
jgi:hypothetical protein